MRDQVYTLVRTVVILALVVIATSIVITAIAYLVTTPCHAVDLCN